MSSETATTAEVAGAGLVIREVWSASVFGVRAYPVRVSVVLGAPDALPGFGMTDRSPAQCRETRDRIRAACLNAGFTWPERRISVQIDTDPLGSGADVADGGSELDAAVAVGILWASRQIEPSSAAAYWGTLGLDGSVEATARRDLVARLFQGDEEVRDVWALDPIGNLAELRRRHVRLADWQRTASSALAQGAHVVLIGRPTSAQVGAVAEVAAGEIILDGDTVAELADVYAAADRSTAPRWPAHASAAPIRWPLATTGAVGMCGGASARMLPGEVSLAHGGILVLDDVTEHGAGVLDCVRGALAAAAAGELHRVSRGARVVEYPTTDFRVLATHDPEPPGRGPAGLARRARRFPAWLRTTGPDVALGGDQGRPVVHVVVPS